jgi:hypothetical protein
MMKRILVQVVPAVGLAIAAAAAGAARLASGESPAVVLGVGAEARDARWRGLDHVCAEICEDATRHHQRARRDPRPGVQREALR